MPKGKHNSPKPKRVIPKAAVELENDIIESAKMGRPEKDIDWAQFEQLCGIHCTQSEIASMLKIHHDTLHDRVEKYYNDTYSNVYKKYQESGKCSLRRNQFVMSKSNASMGIWLGKQYLEQRDTPLDIAVSPESVKGFKSLLDQVAASRSALNSAEININKDVKSE